MEVILKPSEQTAFPTPLAMNGNPVRTKRWLRLAAALRQSGCRLMASVGLLLGSVSVGLLFDSISVL